MPTSEPPSWTIEIIPPGAEQVRPDRRRGAAVLRPYSQRDGGGPGPAGERRRSPRRPAEQGRGRRIDLES